MESYLPISYINDFIFCPRSIYFHQLYGRTEQRLYHKTEQANGKAAHKAIDNKRYSTSKHILQGIDIYSEEYCIGGKIDIYDEKKALLVERKKKIKFIYNGYIFQLYAQYYCLREMGYTVRQLRLHSIDDNKNYPVERPEKNKILRQSFRQQIKQIKEYDMSEPFNPNANKCRNCIYNNICDSFLC
jgi:CRISPR-associated protein Cas4